MKAIFIYIKNNYMLTKTNKSSIQSYIRITLRDIAMLDFKVSFCVGIVAFSKIVANKTLRTSVPQRRTAVFSVVPTCAMQAE